MQHVNWQSYATVYDIILHHNPAYLALVDRFQDEIKRWPIQQNNTLADFGAGTGNFSIVLAKQFQDSEILHIDSDAQMNQIAADKAGVLTKQNLKFITEAVEDLDVVEESLAGIVCVHALYTLTDPPAALHKMQRLLKPGGLAYFCDIGRVLVISDWIKFFIAHLVRQYGVLGTMKFLWNAREGTKQNRIIRDLQKSGRYWTHSHDEFCQVVQQAGFEIISSDVCYRGYSDMVVARKNG
ncbi:MAG: methyltransferase domain-containing protein [Chloroflexota bacterium]